MALADTIIATVTGKHHRSPTYSYFVGSTIAVRCQIRGASFECADCIIPVERPGRRVPSPDGA
jgi:hypothetical protein